MLRESVEEIAGKPGLYFSFFGFYAHAVHSAEYNGRFSIEYHILINSITCFYINFYFRTFLNI